MVGGLADPAVEPPRPGAESLSECTHEVVPFDCESIGTTPRPGVLSGYTQQVTRRLAIAAVIAGALGSLGAGRVIDTSERPQIDVVVRSFLHWPTSLVRPVPDVCGCASPEVQNGSDGVEVATLVRGEPCPTHYTVSFDAGVVGTRTRRLGQCDLNVTAAFDARFPTHWTAPRIVPPFANPLHSGRPATPSIRVELESDPGHARQTRLIRLPDSCSPHHEAVPGRLRVWSTLDEPRVRLVRRSGQEHFQVVVPAGFQGMATLALADCTLELRVADSPSQVSHGSTPLDGGTYSVDTCQPGMGAFLPVPASCGAPERVGGRAGAGPVNLRPWNGIGATLDVQGTEAGAWPVPFGRCVLWVTRGQAPPPGATPLSSSCYEPFEDPSHTEFVAP